MCSKKTQRSGKKRSHNNWVATWAGPPRIRLRCRACNGHWERRIGPPSDSAVNPIWRVLRRLRSDAHPFSSYFCCINLCGPSLVSVSRGSYPVDPAAFSPKRREGDILLLLNSDCAASIHQRHRGGEFDSRRVLPPDSADSSRKGSCDLARVSSRFSICSMPVIYRSC
jgi:hypothetical protein